MFLSDEDPHPAVFLELLHTISTHDPPLQLRKLGFALPTRQAIDDDDDGTSLADLCAAMRDLRCPSLQSLSLSAATLDSPELVAALFELLGSGRLEDLHEVVLNECEFVAMRAAVAGLEQGVSRIETLALRRCQLLPPGSQHRDVDAVVAFLAAASASVTSLEVQQCELLPISTERATQLATALAAPNLTKLVLHDEALSKDCFAALCALLGSTSLHHFGLFSVSLPPEWGASLASLICDSSIRELHLNHLDTGVVCSMGPLYHGLADDTRAKRLQHLSLVSSRTQWSLQGLMGFAAFMSSPGAAHLTHLDVSSVQLGAAAGAVFDALHPPLQSLTMRSCRLATADWSGLFRFAQRPDCTLEFLDCSFNSLDDDLVAELLDSFHSNTSLRTLHLDGNFCDALFAEALERNMSHGVWQLEEFSAENISLSTVPVAQVFLRAIAASSLKSLRLYACHLHRAVPALHDALRSCATLASLAIEDDKLDAATLRVILNSAARWRSPLTSVSLYENKPLRDTPDDVVHELAAILRETGITNLRTPISHHADIRAVLSAPRARLEDTAVCLCWATHTASRHTATSALARFAQAQLFDLNLLAEVLSCLTGQQHAVDRRWRRTRN